MELVETAHELVSGDPEARTTAAPVGILVERVETFAHPLILGGFDGPFDDSTSLAKTVLGGSVTSVVAT